MLGKLFKYDFKAVSRFIWLIYLAVVLSAIGLRISIFAVDKFDEPAFAVLSTIFLAAAYAASVFAVIFGTYIVLIVHFYKSLMQDSGYFFFTLPLSHDEHLIAKLLIGAVLNIAMIAVIMISVIPFLIGNVALPDLFHGLKELFEGIFGIFGPVNGVVMLVFVLFSVLFAAPMKFYFCIIIGQLWRKHRILGAFATYIVLDMVEQMVSFAVNLIVAFSFTPVGNFEDTPFLSSLLVFSIIGLNALIFAGEYIASRLVLKKKLNLE